MKRLVMTADGPKFFKGKKVQAAKDTFYQHLIQKRPLRPLAGPVSLQVEATWPWRAADVSTKAKRERALRLLRIPKDSKPDLSNFIKELEDVLVELRFLENDQSVAELIVRKWFGEEPGILIRIARMEADE